MLFASLIVSAFSALMQHREVQKQAQAQDRIAKEQQKQQDIQQRISDVKASRERANLVRQQRIARASMVARGEATGGAGGSALMGGAGSLTSRTANEIGFNQMSQDAGRQVYASNARISQQNVNIANSQANSALWGAVGGVGSSVFSDAGGWNELGKRLTR
jgi:hypothetical protein